MTKKILTNIEDLPYFTIDHFKNYIKSETSPKIYLHRLAKNGEVIKLKKGIFVSKKKLNRELVVSNIYYSWVDFIGSAVIYTPSYLSLESVLFKEGIIPEHVFTNTYITKNKTLTINNDLGTFLYRNIKEDLFWGYETIINDGFISYIAKKEKAILDYFWLKKDIVFEESYFKELRLNLEKINFGILKKFTIKFKSKKMDKVLFFLEKIYGN